MKLHQRPSRVLLLQDEKCFSSMNHKLMLQLHIYFVAYKKDCHLIEFSSTNEYDLIFFNLSEATPQDKENLTRLKEEGSPHPIIYFYEKCEDLIFFNQIKTTEDEILKLPIISEEFIFKFSKIKKEIPSPNFNLKLGPFTIDSKARIISYMHEFKKLGRREIQILSFLAQKKNEVVSRETILEHLYHQVDLYDRTIDSHISHLRKKLWDLAGPALQIISVYGHGYRIHFQES